jgi:hypothetical protein
LSLNNNQIGNQDVQYLTNALIVNKVNHLVLA